jgi:hypothetical protein
MVGWTAEVYVWTMVDRYGEEVCQAEIAMGRQTKALRDPRPWLLWCWAIVWVSRAAALSQCAGSWRRTEMMMSHCSLSWRTHVKQVSRRCSCRFSMPRYAARSCHTCTRQNSTPTFHSLLRIATCVEDKVQPLQRLCWWSCPCLVLLTGKQQTAEFAGLRIHTPIISIPIETSVKNRHVCNSSNIGRKKNAPVVKNLAERCDWKIDIVWFFWWIHVSEKHEIPISDISLWFSSLGTKKPVMPKKVFVARNLKDCYQIFHSDQRKSKKEYQSFFIATICASLEFYNTTNWSWLLILEHKHFKVW